ncbi:extensin [Spinacia oleracea]|uniref:Extensin n=1 Tax=Spinacia oleracea TaxID=3562 RepID=A0A9R0K5I5_SPIOL|nr:extensin [Spinacia oleracea]
MSIAGVQGQLLEVTVVGCNKLKDTEWISRQDPYVCLEYANNKFRTRTCTDGGKNPVFQEKFIFTLIEGLREINVVVWNSNTLTFDDYIGSGKIQLNDVLSRGYDDRAWSLQTKTGRHAGEVKLIMHFAKTNKPYTNSAPPYAASHQSPQVSMYSAPPPASVPCMNATPAYPPPPTAYHPPPTPCQHPPAAYPSTSPYPYPPNPSAYPSYPYPPPPDQSTYPPPPYPPPHHAPSYPHSGHYPGMYPPPPY